MLSDKKIAEFQETIDAISQKCNGNIENLSVADLIKMHQICLETYCENIENWKLILFWKDLDPEMLLNGEFASDEWEYLYSVDRAGLKGKLNKKTGEFIKFNEGGK